MKGNDRANEATTDDLKAWGKSWSMHPLRLIDETADSVRASSGEEVKAHGLEFVRTADGWKLDRWSPGK